LNRPNFSKFPVQIKREAQAVRCGLAPLHPLSLDVEGPYLVAYRHGIKAAWKWNPQDFEASVGLENNRALDDGHEGMAVCVGRLAVSP
jgi:hypothetical protein